MERHKVNRSRTGITTGFLHHSYLRIGRTRRSEGSSNGYLGLDSRVTRHGAAVPREDIAFFLMFCRGNHTQYHTSAIIRQHGRITGIHTNGYGKSLPFTAVNLAALNGKVLAIHPVRVVRFLVGRTHLGNRPDLNLDFAVTRTNGESERSVHFISGIVTIQGVVACRQVTEEILVSGVRVFCDSSTVFVLQGHRRGDAVHRDCHRRRLHTMPYSEKKQQAC